MFSGGALLAMMNPCLNVQWEPAREYGTNSWYVITTKALGLDGDKRIGIVLRDLTKELAEHICVAHNARMIGTLRSLIYKHAAHSVDCEHDWDVSLLTEKANCKKCGEVRRFTWNGGVYDE